MPKSKPKTWAKAPSPCVSVCKFKDQGHCIGCGMTKPEKKSWKRAPEYRAAIHANLPARMKAMEAAGHRIGPAAGKKR